MKIVESLEDSCLLVKAKQSQMKQKNKRVDFLACYQVIRCQLIRKLSEGKGIKGEIPEQGVLRGSKRAIATIQERGTIRVGIPSNHANKNL